MKFKITLLGLAASLLIVVLFSACKKDGDNNGDGQEKPVAVSIADFEFTPSNLTIAKGVKVTWTNNDSAPHTVTADDNSFTSPTLNKGDTYSHTFANSGTVDYHCAIHPMMTGSVIVQ